MAKISVTKKIKKKLVSVFWKKTFSFDHYRDGAGFITTDQLREIIAELDPRLTKEDLDGIIEEIDEDGSGTMDFDEFCQMMMT